jgi:hypothetical protein
MLPEVDFGTYRVRVSLETGPHGGLIHGSRHMTIRK